MLLGDYADGAATATALLATMAGERQAESLTTPEDLRALLERIGLDHDQLVPRDVGEVRELRDSVAEILMADDPAAAVTALNRLLSSTRATVALAPDPRGAQVWQWQLRVDGDAGVAIRLALRIVPGLLSIVGSYGVQRFRRCSADRCSGLFVDASKAGRRKFCDPSRCGARTHVAAHRARVSGRPRRGT